MEERKTEKLGQGAVKREAEKKIESKQRHKHTDKEEENKIDKEIGRENRYRDIGKETMTEK